MYIDFCDREGDEHALGKKQMFILSLRNTDARPFGMVKFFQHFASGQLEFFSKKLNAYTKKFLISVEKIWTYIHTFFSAENIRN